MKMIRAARMLRKRMTVQEVKLWARLRDMKPLGFHFRRQAPIGRYIVDFVCFSRRLIVEADGGQHAMECQSNADALRDKFFRSQGFRVLRFWNSDIDQNPEGVAHRIVAVLKTPHPGRLTPADPPHKGEGRAGVDS